MLAFSIAAAGRRLQTRQQVRPCAATDLEWTVVYPGLLTNGPATSTGRALDLAAVTHVPGLPRISRADVATFLLKVAAEPAWNRKTVVLLAK